MQLLCSVQHIMKIALPFAVLLSTLVQCCCGLDIQRYSSDPVQYHIQRDTPHQRYFRYQTYSGQWRKEKRLSDGAVVGAYGWTDDLGMLRLYDYMADDKGYRVVRQRNIQLPVTDDVGGKKKNDKWSRAGGSLNAIGGRNEERNSFKRSHQLYSNRRQKDGSRAALNLLNDSRRKSYEKVRKSLDNWSGGYNDKNIVVTANPASPAELNESPLNVVTEDVSQTASGPSLPISNSGNISPKRIPLTGTKQNNNAANKIVAIKTACNHNELKSRRNSTKFCDNQNTHHSGVNNVKIGTSRNIKTGMKVNSPLDNNPNVRYIDNRNKRKTDVKHLGTTSKTPPLRNSLIRGRKLRTFVPLKQNTLTNNDAINSIDGTKSLMQALNNINNSHNKSITNIISKENKVNSYQNILPFISSTNSSNKSSSSLLASSQPRDSTSLKSRRVPMSRRLRANPVPSTKKKDKQKPSQPIVYVNRQQRRKSLSSSSLTSRNSAPLRSPVRRNKARRVVQSRRTSPSYLSSTVPPVDSVPNTLVLDNQITSPIPQPYRKKALTNTHNNLLYNQTAMTTPQNVIPNHVTLHTNINNPTRTDDRPSTNSASVLTAPDSSLPIPESVTNPMIFKNPVTASTNPVNAPPNPANDLTTADSVLTNTLGLLTHVSTPELVRRKRKGVTTQGAKPDVVTIHYDTGTMFHFETRDAAGVRTGRHGYVDPLGFLRVTQYVSGPEGHKETRTSRRVGQRRAGDPL